MLLDPRPARRVGAAFSFATLRAALEANVAILETGPSAVEFLDLAPLRRAPNVAQYRSVASLLDGDDAAMLTVEYQGDDDEALAGLARLRSLAGSLGAAQAIWLEQPPALADAAALRRAVLPLLMGAPGAERPAAFVEDTAVAPERLADFVADLQRILATHGTRASFTGHASAGCLHLRPMLDLKIGSRSRGHGGSGRRGGRAGRGLPRRHLRRARLRPLAQLVPAEASRTRSLRGDGGGQGRVRPRPAAQPRRGDRRAGGHRAPALRPRLPRRRRLGAAAVLRRRGRVRARGRALLRRGPLQEADGHDVPAGCRDPRRGALDPGARQRAPGRGLRGGAARRDRRR